MKPTDVKQVLDDVDALLRDYEQRVTRLESAYEYRKARLEHDRNRKTLNPVIRDRLERAIRAVEDARNVQHAFAGMLGTLLRFSRTAIESHTHEALPADATTAARLAEFLKFYTLAGHVATVQVLVIASVSLREI